MPKSIHTFSPPRSLPSKHSLNAQRDDDDTSSKMSETALRKKKNADAQAAFRARRANYIATLEETVTSLESVVLQLQDSCREARTEAAELRQENIRLIQALDSAKHESREREKLLKSFWQAKKSGSGHDSTLDDLPPSSSSFASVTPQSTPGPLSNSHINHHNAGPYASPSSIHDPLRYQTHEEPSGALTPSYHQATPTFGDRSPSIPFLHHESEGVNPHARQMDPHRLPKIGPFYMPGAPREGDWQSPGVAQSNPAAGDSGHPDSADSAHSPGFIPSPNLTTNEISYPNRFLHDDQKTTITSMESQPYIFNQNRSISPTNSNHTGSSTSVSTTPFQFVFPENQDRQEPDFRRHNAHGAELTLHGGMADISTFTRPTRSHLGPQVMPPFSPAEEHPRDDHRNNGESASPSRRSRRHAPQSSPSRPSRSPSPGGHHPISSTLAVIKAQAFGALRRTRTRPKKGTDGAAKAAMEVLEARGIGLGLPVASGSGTKRQRVHADDEGMQS